MTNIKDSNADQSVFVTVGRDSDSEFLRIPFSQIRKDDYLLGEGTIAVKDALETDGGWIVSTGDGRQLTPKSFLNNPGTIKCGDEVNAEKAWHYFMDVMDEGMFYYLTREFNKNYEMDPWDHEDGWFDIQLWLPYFCGTVAFNKTNQPHQIAYIDTAMNTESDVTQDNIELLRSEADRLNNTKEYSFRIVNGNLLYLECEIKLSDDVFTALKEVFDKVIEINNWVDEWFHNEWPKAMRLYNSEKTEL